MNPQHTLSKSRAQLSEKLLAYSAATAATLGATSAAEAQTLDAGYFGGSLPTITFSSGTFANENDSIDFTVGAGSFRLSGAKFSHYNPGFYSPGSPGFWSKSSRRYSYPVAGYTYHFPGNSGFSSPGSSSHGGHLELNLLGGLQNVKINGNTFAGGYLFRSRSGNVYTNLFGSGAHSGVLSFNTSGGGLGSLSLEIGFDSSGPAGNSGVTGGSFASAIPEPASAAYGLGLVALGFAGIREHRRRRAAAKGVARK